MLLPPNILAVVSPLAMGFGMPGLAIAGVLLATIPVIIHILNRRRYKVHRWAAMEYLLEALRRNRRRLKFEHWLLMTLRCGAVLLAGLALARPMGCSQSAVGRVLGQSSRLNVIVIDNAASMAWQSSRADSRTNFERAKKLSAEILAGLANSHDAVCIIAAAEGDSSAASRTPTYDLEAAGRALEQVAQRYTRTDLAGALQQALTVAGENPTLPNRRLYILTDSTRHAWEPSAAAEVMRKLGPELAKLYEIVHVDVGEKQMVNASVQSLRVLGNVATTHMPMDMAAKAVASGGSSEETLTWRSGNRVLGTSAKLHLEADSPEQTLPQVAFGTEGPTAVTARLEPGDRLPEDDELSVALQVRRRLSVMVAEGDRGRSALESAGAFVQLALAPGGEGGSGEAGAAKVDVVGESELAGRVLGGDDAVILAAVPRPSETQASELKRYVEEGGTLVIFMGEGVSLEAYNRTLLPAGLLPGKLGTVAALAEGQAPFQFDFKPDAPLHPLLRVFRGEGKSGLGTARVFTYVKVAVDAKSQAERVLDMVGGDPGITVQAVGRGKVVFFATSADTRWTTLPAKPAFVALLNEILLGSVDPENAWMNLDAGQRLEIPQRVAGRQSPRLSDPSGHELALEPGDGGKGKGAFVSEPLQRPGLYRLQVDGRTYPIAVRFPAEESDLTRIGPAEIRRALGEVEMELAEDRLPASVTSGKDQNDFGWPLMVAVLALLGMEAFLAMWFRR